MKNHEKYPQNPAQIQDAQGCFLSHPKGHFTSPQVAWTSQLISFTRVGDPLTVKGTHRKIFDGDGHFANAECYLGPDGHIDGATRPPDKIVLHPCVDEAGDQFIMVQVLERPSGGSAIWEQSMAAALSLPIGQWLRIWSIQGQQRVEFELLEPMMTNTPVYPQFLWDVRGIAIASQARDLEHRVRSLIKEIPKESVPVCPGCGEPMTAH